MGFPGEMRRGTSLDWRSGGCARLGFSRGDTPRPRWRDESGFRATRKRARSSSVRAPSSFGTLAFQSASNKAVA